MAPPTRVFEDEAELHPPPEALPQNPWDEEGSGFRVSGWTGPVGTCENSPAIHRWGLERPKLSESRRDD